MALDFLNTNYRAKGYDPKKQTLSDYNIKNYTDAAGQAQTRESAQAGYTTANLGQAQQDMGASRNIYSDLTKQLQDQMAGKTKSAAQLMLDQANQRSLKQIVGQIANTQGINPALAARMMGTTGSDMQTQANAQAAIQKAQEDAQAQQALLGAAQGQTQLANLGSQNAFNQANMNQNVNLANLSATQNQQQMNDNLTQFYMNQGLNAQQAQLKANLDLEQMKLTNALNTDKINSDIENQNAQRQANFWGQLLGGLTSVGTSMALGGNTAKPKGA